MNSQQTDLGVFKLGPNDINQGIYVGDAKTLARDLPDECIDLIFTDPPYPRKFIQVFYDMGEYAARVLKPGGSLFTLCGHYQVPQVLDALSTLDYHWIGWFNHNMKRTLFGYKIVCGGKPLLWFTKGKVNEFPGFWWDTVSPPRPDKRHHKWGQPVEWALPTINQFQGLVLDPFCGGGTVPATCTTLKRQWLAFEVDPEVADQARKRIKYIQHPLFTVLYQRQLPLEV